MKKIIPFILPIAGIVFIICAFFFFRKNQIHYADPFSIVPHQVAFILECEKGNEWEQYQEWLLKLPLDNSVPGDSSDQRPAFCRDLLQRLTTVQRENKRWASVRSHSPFLLVAPLLSGKNARAFIFGLNDRENQQTADTLVQALFPRQSFSSRTYRNQLLYESRDVAYAFIRQCLVVSSSPAFLEDLLAPSLQPVSTQRGWATAKQTTAADLPVHFYFSWGKDRWAALDVSLYNQQEILMGYIAYGDSLLPEIPVADIPLDTANASALPNTSPGDQQLSSFVAAHEIKANPSNFPTAFTTLFGSHQWMIHIIPYDRHKQRINIISQRNVSEHKPASFPVSGQPEGALWAVRLSAPVQRGPWIVTNHMTRDAEVVVQDQNNLFYLIDQTGKIQWSKKLPEAIVGHIIQIDALRNNKLQMAFCTKHTLYVVDRNGNDLQGFPVRLPTTMTGEMAVFDYDQNKNYRFLIAGENGQLYNYSISGKKTEGWNFSSLSQTIIGFDHFRIGKEDFLVIVGEKGKIKLLKRNGQQKSKVNITADGYSGRGMFVIPGISENTSRLIYLAKSGKVIALTLDGKQRQEWIQDISEKAFIVFSDIQNSGEKIILLADGTILSAYHPGGEKIFTAEVEGNILYAPHVFSISPIEKKIGVVTHTGKFYLFSSSGILEAGYPKAADADAVIADFQLSGHPATVTAKEESIIAYP